MYLYIYVHVYTYMCTFMLLANFNFKRACLISDSSTGNEKSEFLAEIEMMKKIAEGYNAHIVNMVGCVTVQEPLCLITEFLPYGDLLSYLKYQRKKVSTHIII